MINILDDYQLHGCVSPGPCWGLMIFGREIHDLPWSMWAVWHPDWCTQWHVHVGWVVLTVADVAGLRGHIRWGVVRRLGATTWAKNGGCLIASLGLANGGGLGGAPDGVHTWRRTDNGGYGHWFVAGACWRRRVRRHSWGCGGLRLDISDRLCLDISGLRRRWCAWRFLGRLLFLLLGLLTVLGTTVLEPNLGAKITWFS